MNTITDVLRELSAEIDVHIQIESMYLNRISSIRDRIQDRSLPWGISCSAITRSSHYITAQHRLVSNIKRMHMSNNYSNST